MVSAKGVIESLLRKLNSSYCVDSGCFTVLWWELDDVGGRVVAAKLQLNNSCCGDI